MGDWKVIRNDARDAGRLRGDADESASLVNERERRGKRKR
jgi:hypothetical protein